MTKPRSDPGHRGAQRLCLMIWKSHFLEARIASLRDVDQKGQLRAKRKLCSMEMPRSSSYLNSSQSKVWSPSLLPQHFVGLRGLRDKLDAPPADWPGLWILGWIVSSSVLKVLFLHCYSLEYHLSCLLWGIISWPQPFLRVLVLREK